jgi:hypothetical protein
MILFCTEKRLKIEKQNAVIDFMKTRVPAIKEDAVNSYVKEQEKFASIVDQQPKCVWNDEPVYFNFPYGTKVVSVTREDYDTEMEHTQVKLLVGESVITESRYKISREAHREIVEGLTSKNK